MLTGVAVLLLRRVEAEKAGMRWGSLKPLESPTSPNLSAPKGGEGQ
jgi:hypothetical protein